MAVAEAEARALRVAVDGYRRIAESAPAPVEDDVTETGNGLRLAMGIVLMAWALAAAGAWAVGIGWASWVMVGCAVAGFALLGG